MTLAAPATVYISTIEPNAGKSLVSLGLVDLLLRRSARIGYFRPVITEADDAHLRLILEQFTLSQNPTDSYAYLAEQANVLLGQGRSDEENRLLGIRLKIVRRWRFAIVGLLTLAVLVLARSLYTIFGRVRPLFSELEEARSLLERANFNMAESLANHKRISHEREEALAEKEALLAQVASLLAQPGSEVTGAANQHTVSGDVAKT